MAKRAICDMCRAEGPLEGNYGSVPSTWFKLRQGWADERELCSYACLVAEVERRRPLAADPRHPTEAETPVGA